MGKLYVRSFITEPAQTFPFLAINILRTVLKKGKRVKHHSLSLIFYIRVYHVLFPRTFLSRNGNFVYFCFSCFFFLQEITRVNSSKLRSGMNIDWLMTWWHKRWKETEALCGLARITMEMYSPILWHRVTVSMGEQLFYCQGNLGTLFPFPKWSFNILAIFNSKPGIPNSTPSEWGYICK